LTLSLFFPSVWSMESIRWDGRRTIRLAGGRVGVLDRFRCNSPT
jgi:hypothetical protein